MDFPNPKNYKRVDKIHDVKRTSQGWTFYRQADKKTPISVTIHQYNIMAKVLDEIAGKEFDKYGYVPAKAIMNMLEKVDEEFKLLQEEWQKKNKHLRNTSAYQLDYYHVLLLKDNLGEIAYYRKGHVELTKEAMKKKDIFMLELDENDIE